VNATSVVLKFGSSVVTDRDCLPRVVHEIYRYYRRGHHVLAAVSAIGHETDSLLSEARCWSTPPAPESAVAELLATGDRQSAALLSMALERAGVHAGLLSPADIKLSLSGERLDAWPTSVDIQAIQQAFRSNPVLVLPGFAGAHENGGTALMGRGGTDLTAVFLAQALDAAECRLVKMSTAFRNGIRRWTSLASASGSRIVTGASPTRRPCASPASWCSPRPSSICAIGSIAP
jgi:homoserine dehydrogenase